MSTFALDWDTETAVGRFGERQKEREAKRQPSPEETAAQESLRKTRRDRIKKDIARGVVLRRQYDEMSAQIEAINARKEHVAAEHVEACGPIQTRLKQIESELIAGLSDREQADLELTAEREDLLVQLREHNVNLKTRIASEDRLLAQVESDRSRVGFEAAGCETESDLLVEGVVKKELYQAYRAADAVFQRFAAWVRTLTEESGKGSKRAEAQLALITKYHDDAETEMNQAIRACIDE